MSEELGKVEKDKVYDEMYDKHMRELGSVKEEVLREYGRQLDELYEMIQAFDKNNRDSLFRISISGSTLKHLEEKISMLQKWNQEINNDHARCMRRMDILESKFNILTQNPEHKMEILSVLREGEHIIDKLAGSPNEEKSFLANIFTRLKVMLGYKNDTKT